LALVNQSLSFWDKLNIASQGSVIMSGFGLGVLGVESSTTVTLAIGMLAFWLAVILCHILTMMPRDT
jgi:hypothetical protein